MSLIVHRCTDCQHIAEVHSKKAGGGRGFCTHHRCQCGQFGRGPSEVLPTWDTLTGAPITVVADPRANRPSHNDIERCACDSCIALYERLTA